MKIHKLLPALSLLAWAALPSMAEDADTQADANNPLAFKAGISFHNYYIGDLTIGDGDDTLGKYADQGIIRFAQPFTIGETKWIGRASLNINNLPALDGYDTGLGDLNLLTSYIFDTNPGISFGIGPMLNIPTATEDSLGSGKWSGGLANVFFNKTSPKFQYGYLATYAHSFAGDDDRDTVNLGSLQLFGFYQLGKGYYLRTSPIMTYNFENDNYMVPVGLGFGKVFNTDYATFNLFVEPQYSVFRRGAGLPEWQVFTGLNIQF
ncbi:MAG: hypothetical protein ACK5LE_06965 [Alphaproteobacteria bacterium]